MSHDCRTRSVHTVKIQNHHFRVVFSNPMALHIILLQCDGLGGLVCFFAEIFVYFSGGFVYISRFGYGDIRKHGTNGGEDEVFI
jgi:hypothetical protein